MTMNGGNAAGPGAPVKDEDDVEIEYVAAPLEVEEEDEENPVFTEFNDIFSRFNAREDGFASTYVKPKEEEADGTEAAEDEGGVVGGAKKEGDEEEADDEGGADDEGASSEEEDDEESELSRKAKKLLTRMKVASYTL